MQELRRVAYEGNFLRVKSLCREGGQESVNGKGPDTERTPLHWGVLGGHGDIVSYLLKAAKADIDPIDSDGNTPLNLVIQASELPLRKKLLIVDILLAHRADPYRPNHEGKTPLMNLEELRKQIPDSHYHHRKEVDNTIRRMKGNFSRAPGSVVDDRYVSRPRDLLLATQPAPGLHRPAMAGG